MPISKNKIKFIHSLKEKKYRDAYNLYVAEGDKLVSELLGKSRCNLLCATSDFLVENKNKISSIDEIIEISSVEIAKLSFLKNPQHAIGIFFKQDQSYTIKKNIENKLCLALDGIQDPGNLGTIIRLADWFGINDVFCSLDTVDVYNSKVVQATMGAIQRVRVHYLNLEELLKEIKNVPIYGTFLNGENIYQSDLSKNGIIIMGNEGNGIRPEIERIVTKRLFIPNYPLESERSESLNVAVATAIVCNEFRRLAFLE